MPGNCTWTEVVTIAGKAITLSGAGIDQTVITDGMPNAGYSEVLMAISLASANGLRLTQMTLAYNGAAQRLSDMIEVTGTGLVFGNSVTNAAGDPYEDAIARDNTRSCEQLPGPLSICDGSNPLDDNEDSSGWPCLDQIGRSTDFGPGTARLPQESQPVYVWNNTLNATPADALVLDLCSADLAHIRLGRDYFNVPMPGYAPFVYPHPLAAP